MGAGSRSRVLGAPPRGSRRDRDAGHVRPRHRGDRQPGGRDLRGLRLVRAAAAGRLRRADAQPFAGAGRARRRRLRVHQPGHAGVALGLAGGRRDGRRRLRRALRRRRQLGARGCHRLAAARVHPAGVAARLCVVDPGSARRLGPRVGSVVPRGRPALAGTRAQPLAHRGRRRVPRARGAASHRDRLHPRRRCRPLPRRARRRDRPLERSRRRRPPDVLRDALPADGPGHHRPGDRAARRRAELAERRHPPGRPAAGRHCRPPSGLPRQGARGVGARARRRVARADRRAHPTSSTPPSPSSASRWSRWNGTPRSMCRPPAPTSRS